jgi:hypothetical protein
MEDVQTFPISSPAAKLGHNGGDCHIVAAVVIFSKRHVAHYHTPLEHNVRH